MRITKTRKSPLVMALMVIGPLVHPRPRMQMTLSDYFFNM